MQTMTGYERVLNTLRHQPIDQVACHDSLWDETIERWKAEGAIAPDVSDYCNQLLEMDMAFGGGVTAMADLDCYEVVEEDEDTRLTRDGNGALYRHHKQHESCPEHVGFAVTDRTGWEARIKPHLQDFNPRRIDVDGYRTAMQRARERQQFFSWWGAGPFEMMQTLCGHEHLLMGFADDPDWVREMVMTYARLIIIHLEELFTRAGHTDGFTMGDDLGFKGKPFMSPAMYREIVFPGHRLLFDSAHSHGLPVAGPLLRLRRTAGAGAGRGRHGLPAGNGSKGRHGYPELHAGVHSAPGLLGQHRCPRAHRQRPCVDRSGTGDESSAAAASRRLLHPAIRPHHPPAGGFGDHAILLCPRPRAEPGNICPGISGRGTKPRVSSIAERLSRGALVRGVHARQGVPQMQLGWYAGRDAFRNELLAPSDETLATFTAVRDFREWLGGRILV